jgi:hypothetical protein
MFLAAFGMPPAAFAQPAVVRMTCVDGCARVQNAWAQYPGG